MQVVRKNYFGENKCYKKRWMLSNKKHELFDFRMS